MPNSKPLYFFWDHNLSEDQAKKLIKEGNPTEKNWVISRILEHAKWQDIWKFLTLDEIKHSLPQLRINPRLKKIWQYAILRWSGGK